MKYVIHNNLFAFALQRAVDVVIIEITYIT